MELIEQEIRLPKTLSDKIGKLAAMGGLTGTQMLQAILVLDMHAHGWLKDEMKPEAEPEGQE